MAKPETIDLHVGKEIKSQAVRLLDVFFIGPMMVWGGVALRSHSEIAGWTLVGLGAATVIYNGRNYLTIRKRLQE